MNQMEIREDSPNMGYVRCENAYRALAQALAFTPQNETERGYYRAIVRAAIEIAEVAQEVDFDPDTDPEMESRAAIDFEESMKYFAGEQMANRIS
jgi:hypothetical protein